MLPLLCLLSVVGRLVAVDLGTESLKMDNLLLSGEPHIVKNAQSGQIGTSSFKKSSPFKRPICAANLVRIEVKTCAQAVNLCGAIRRSVMCFCCRRLAELRVSSSTRRSLRTRRSASVPC
jgi:hypothetical protein